MNNLFTSLNLVEQRSSSYEFTYLYNPYKFQWHQNGYFPIRLICLTTKTALFCSPMGRKTAERFRLPNKTIEVETDLYSSFLLFLFSSNRRSRCKRDREEFLQQEIQLCVTNESSDFWYSRGEVVVYCFECGVVLCCWFFIVSSECKLRNEMDSLDANAKWTRLWLHG